MACNLDLEKQLTFLHDQMGANGDYLDPRLSAATAVAKAMAVAVAAEQMILQSEGASSIEWGGGSGETIRYDLKILAERSDKASAFARMISGSGGISYVNTRCYRR